MTRILRTTCIGLLMGLIGVFQAQAQVPQPPEIAARAYLLVVKDKALCTNANALHLER
jgi:hypothetical protein